MHRDIGNSRNQALEVQRDLQVLQADHARLTEQYDLAHICNAGLRHDLKACKRSLKQVWPQPLQLSSTTHALLNHNQATTRLQTSDNKQTVTALRDQSVIACPYVQLIASVHT